MKITHLLFVCVSVFILSSCTSFLDEKLGLEPIRVDKSSKPKTYLNLYAKVPKEVLHEVEKTVSIKADAFYDKNGKEKPLEDLNQDISKEFFQKGYTLKPAFFGYRPGVFVVLDYNRLYATY